jgi:hypothetical protein
MPDPLIVTLRPFEIEMAATVGVQRHVRALALGKRPTDGVPADRLWQIHVEGALGELAFAKATGRYWGGSVGTYRTAATSGKSKCARPASRTVIYCCTRRSPKIILPTRSCWSRRTTYPYATRAAWAG